MNGTREPIFVAIQQIINDAYAWGMPVERKLKLWTQVPSDLRPACFMYEGGDEIYKNDNSPNAKRPITAYIFVYTNAVEVVGSIELNLIMDAIETALQPRGADLYIFGGRQTLGGLCYNARINGTIDRNPGDIDGDGMLIIPLTIELP